MVKASLIVSGDIDSNPAGCWNSVQSLGPCCTLDPNWAKFGPQLGNLDPSWAIFLKSGQSVSRSGQNFLFIGDFFLSKSAQKNLWIKNRNWSSYCRSLHDFQSWLFICYLFGCKLWLLSIQNLYKNSPILAIVSVYCRAQYHTGCFWGVFGVFCVRTYPRKGVWLLGKEQGLEVVFWANWDPIWAKWDPCGQFVRKVGKSALELGKKFSHKSFNVLLTNQL